MYESESISILIAENDRSQGELLQNYLFQHDNIGRVELVTNGLDALTQIQAMQPQIVLMDLLLSQVDGFGVLAELNKMEIARRPHILVTTALNRIDLVQKAMMLGSDYIMLKPCDPEQLYQRVQDMIKTQPVLPVVEPLSATRAPVSLDERITGLFLSIGIPAHIKGYQFLREGVKMVLDDPSLVNAITKALYPGIARRCGSSSSKVERAIRHAIDVAWSRGHVENLNQEFGYSLLNPKQKPTNGEFIALVADRLSLEQDR